MARPTPADLRNAAEWCESYEPADSGDQMEQSLTVVKAWLRAESDRREREAVSRGVARLLGVPVAVARAAYDRKAAEGRQ